MKHMKKFVITSLACLMMAGTTLAPVSTANAAVRATVYAMPDCPNCRISGPVVARGALYCAKCGKFVGTRYHCQKCYTTWDVKNIHRC